MSDDWRHILLVIDYCILYVLGQGFGSFILPTPMRRPLFVSESISSCQNLVASDQILYYRDLSRKPYFGPAVARYYICLVFIKINAHKNRDVDGRWIECTIYRAIRFIAGYALLTKSCVLTSFCTFDVSDVPYEFLVIGTNRWADNWNRYRCLGRYYKINVYALHVRSIWHDVSDCSCWAQQPQFYSSIAWIMKYTPFFSMACPSSRSSKYSMSFLSKARVRHIFPLDTNIRI